MDTTNKKAGDFVADSHFDVKLVALIDDERLTPTMERVRNGKQQMFREKDFDSRGFMTNEPDTCIIIENTVNKEYFSKLIDDKWWWVNGCAECCGHKRNWMSYVECEKHDVCSCCSKPRSHFKGSVWGGQNGWTCNSCTEIKANILKQERLEAVASEDYNEWDYYNESEMKCPHCATTYQQDEGEPDEDQECHVCGGEFTVTVEYSVTYSTEVKGERLLPDSHKEEAA